MVNCQALDRVNGSFEFQKYQWNEVVAKLDNENKEYEAWQAQQKENPGESSSKPLRKIRASLVRAMEALDERDIEQMFWEIRLYAARNEKMHSGVLDLRGKAKYDEVLAIIRDDLNTIEDLLPEEKRNEASRYRECVTRYRKKWWSQKEGIGEKLILTKSDAAKNHEKAVKEAATVGAKSEPPDLPATPMEKIQKALNSVAEQLADQRPLVEDSNKKIRAIGEAVASATEVNATQKRVLSTASWEDQDRKRQRIDNEEALRELSGGYMDEDE